MLTIQGTARIDLVDEVATEYADAAQRYVGREQGRAWVEQLGRIAPELARIAVTPNRVTVLDFETRFPSALARRMS